MNALGAGLHNARFAVLCVSTPGLPAEPVPPLLASLHRGSAPRQRAQDRLQAHA